MLIGRHIAFMICAIFKGRATGMNDLLNIELRSDSLQMFDQAWEETLMAMDIEPDMASCRVCIIGNWSYTIRIKFTEKSRVATRS